MMAGCALSQPEKVAVDLAVRRCPEIAAGEALILSQAPLPAPAGNVTRAAAQQWIDGLGAQIRQINRAGARVLALYHACRAGNAVGKAGA